MAKSLHLRHIVVAFALSSCLGAGIAAPPDAQAGLSVLRDEDLRVATILRRLALANAPLCEDNAPLHGLLIHNARQYAEAFRPSAIALFGVGAAISVEAVIPGSSADRAGLRTGDVLLSVNNVPFPSTPMDGKASRTAIETATHILQEAASSGKISLSATRNGQPFSMEFVPETGCASTIQVVPDNRKDSGADGRMISITTAMVEFMRSDDELATLIGHELAHNALGHPAFLNAKGRPSALVRQTEEEADRVGLYFVARAGYDPAGAPALWDRLGRAFGLNILSEPTHPPLKRRIAASHSTLSEIAAKQKRGDPLLP